MKVLILMGSPRNKSNTAELCKPFIEELEQQGAQVSYVKLHEKKIAPCKGCYACQHVTGAYGCVQEDDMQEIVDQIVWADCIILATPIYAWYCSAEMKAVLDRHYGLNKYYGRAEGSLWEGKRLGIIATHGYGDRYATEPFELGMKRLCKHSALQYVGMYSVRDTDDMASFQTEEAVAGARRFARMVMACDPEKKIQLRRASLEDAENIWKMQVESFSALLDKYQDMDTNPANEPLEKVLMRLNQKDTYFYLICYKGDAVGAIRVIDRSDDNSMKRISPIFVLPEYHNKGIAQAAIIEAERIHGTNQWELDTILQETGNCYLYEKMGYRRTEKRKEINDRLTLVFYEKP